MTEPPPAGRWQAWAFGLLLAAAALHCLRPLWDDDLFWHLANGRLTLAAHRLPAHDPFTYTAIHAWVHDEWLSEELLAGAERSFGLGGLRLLCSGLVVAGLALLWLLSPERGAPGRFALVAVAWIGVLPNASLRPHTVAWPLAVAVLAGAARRAVAAWDRGESWPSRLLWLAALGLGTAVWINLHASALIVPALLGIAAAGGVADWLLRRAERPAGGSWVAAAVALAACALQPAGLGLLRHVAATPAINALSEEWQPLLTLDSWRTFPSAVVGWWLLLAATLAAGIAERRRGRLVPAGFPGFWASLACLLLAAQHRRMIVFFFVPALWLAPHLGKVWAAASDSARRLLAAAAVATTAVLVFVELPDALARGPLRAGIYPEQATAFLTATDLDGRLFHDLGWGGYLELHRFPRQQVFADGRWLLGGPRMLADYRTMYGREGSREDVDRMFERWRVAAVVQSTAVVVAAPALVPERWALAWIDPTATVLLRRGQGFAERRRRVCSSYAAHPALLSHARWPPQLAASPGSGAAAIRPVIDECRSGA
ncbi:MAG: hypothetical protein JOZ15_20000 [Acidobacteria bacterium]|nr:hypothetical protein [Acidobacteriota bacterium]